MQSKPFAAMVPIIARACLGCALALGATAPGAQTLGTRARATISIRASVMPRFEVQGRSGDRSDSPILLRSNAPSLRVQVVGVPRGDPPATDRKANAATMLLIVPD